MNEWRRQQIEAQSPHSSEAMQDDGRKWFMPKKWKLEKEQVKIQEQWTDQYHLIDPDGNRVNTFCYTHNAAAILVDKLNEIDQLKKQLAEQSHQIKVLKGIAAKK